MSANEIKVPFEFFSDIDGEPLEAGYIYIGVENLDPESNPATVYWDRALTLVAAQPFRTLNGYVVNSGTPTNFYVNADGYSITVRNKNGSLIYTNLSVREAIPFSAITGSAAITTRADSVATLIASSYSESLIAITGYYGGWAATTAGPKGGFIAFKTGATNSAPSAGTAVSVSSIGGGDGSGSYTGQIAQAGLFWDADGDEWKISRDQEINDFMFGVLADGTTEDTVALNDFCNFISGRKGFLRNNGNLHRIVNSTVNVPQETSLIFEINAVVRPGSSMVSGDYVFNLGKACELHYPQIYDSVLERRNINGIRCIEGSPVAGNARIISPRMTDMGIGIYIRGHNNRIEDPLLWSNSIGIYIGSDPSETEPGGTSGSAVIDGGRLHDNNFGVWQSVEGIDAYYCGGIVFEYNRRHVHTEGNAHMVDCYMKDAANIDIEGSGKVYITATDTASLSSGNSRLDNLPFAWDSSSTGSDFSSSYSIDYAYIKDVQLFVGQPNVTPRDRWATFDNGTYTLDNVNVQMAESVTAGAKHLAVAQTALSSGAVFTSSSKTYNNYCSNGLFTEREKLTSEYIESTTAFTVDATRLNPWGGACLNVYRTGVGFRYKVPNWDSARRYLLVVLKGEVLSGTGQATGVDMANSDITNITTANLTTNKATSGNAVCISGVKYSDREVIGATSFIVTLDAPEGVIKLTNTLTATTGNEELYGVILTDIDAEDVDDLEHMPIGNYKNFEVVPYKAGTTVGLPIYESKAFDPANIPDGSGQTTTTTVTGAQLGMMVETSFSLDLQGLIAFSWVSAADTVSTRFYNETGGAVDLASGTLRLKVY